MDRRNYLDADDKGTAAGDPDTAGWALSVLLEAGAIRECEEHGWMKDRADPHARERRSPSPARSAARPVSGAAVAAVVRDVLDSIGDTCPECN